MTSSYAVAASISGPGLEMDPPHTAPYGMRQLYLKDPDGFVICLQWPADS